LPIEAIPGDGIDAVVVDAADAWSVAFFNLVELR
jgi:hypothetical protein